MYSDINKANINLTNENILLKNEIENYKVKCETVVKSREQLLQKYNNEIAQKNECLIKKEKYYER